MISEKKSVYLRDTDATGVLYFTEQLRMANEVFEAYLGRCGIGLRKMLDAEEWLLPIVHVEADYLMPLFAGDELEVFLYIKHIGCSSFTLSYTFYRGGVEVGSVCIVHVCVCCQNKTPISIPPALLAQIEIIPFSK